jgi:hypothetical protein
MQFRDWQTCENLHTAKTWQHDGFKAAALPLHQEIALLKEDLLWCLENLKMDCNKKVNLKGEFK